MVSQLLKITACFLLLATSAHGQDQTPKWITDGPKLIGTETSFDVPLTRRGAKLYAQVELGGIARRFVVDTGSPSMINSALADELGLTKVGTSKGRDSHGVIIESDIVQADLTVGQVQFSKVPMFSADFESSEALKYFIGDGVLGSELLALGAWQVDLQGSRLRFEKQLADLPNLKEATRVDLYDFGYPHAPIMDIQFTDNAKSKALFDTGAPTFFTVSSPDLEGASKNSGVGRTVEGFGSSGGSLGGQAPMSEQLLVELKSLSIGELTLGRVESMQRDLSPSLIGAKLLDQFIVTFDVQSKSAYFARFKEQPFSVPSFGFTLAFDEQISIAVVWEDSPAAAAGIQPGMIVESINGVPTACTTEGIAKALAALEDAQVELHWQGGSAVLSKMTTFLDR